MTMNVQKLIAYSNSVDQQRVVKKRVSFEQLTEEKI